MYYKINDKIVVNFCNTKSTNLYHIQVLLKNIFRKLLLSMQAIQYDSVTVQSIFQLALHT